MQPDIQNFSPVILAGFSFFGDPFHSHAGWSGENEIGRLWQRLIGFLELGSFSPPDPGVSYEIHLQNHESNRTGEFEVFVGFEIKSLENIPVELCLKILPGGDYAIFTLKGEQIHADEPILDDWFAASGCRPAHTFFAQRYDARFKGLERLAESEVDILVPLQ